MTPRTQNVRKRLGTRRANTIANSIRIFRGLEGLAEVPYLSPLKPICGLAISILDLVQTIRQLRDDHTELIDRITQLAAILDRSKDENWAIIAEVGDLERSLNEILSILEAECQLSWFQRVRKTQELKDNVIYCTAKVDKYIECFTVASLLRIHNLLSEDKDEVQVFKRSQIFLARSFAPTLAPLRHGELFRGWITHSPCSRVVVKQYDKGDAGKHAYLRDVQLLRRLRHPNLHQLMGTSTPAAETHFLVLPEFESGGVANFINRKLGSSGVDSFMATLRVYQGIASGIDYLRRQCSELHQSELEACFQSSNIVLTPEGQPIIGHNLVLDSPVLTSKKSPQELDAWLKNRLNELVNCITYGTLDLSDWGLLMARQEGRRASHLRLFEHFTSFAIPSFTHSTLLLDSLLEALDHPHRRGELSFPAIRAAAVDLWSGAFVYRPNIPIQCTVGDVGYMDDNGQFVMLTNVSDQVAGGVVEDVSVVLRSASGNTDVRSFPDGPGMIRHQFGKTLFASIRRRKLWQKFTSSHPAWLYFIPNAKRICDMFSTVERPLKERDLIFIVGVEEDLRISIFDRKSVPDELPFEVEFLETEDPLEGASWGEWHTENRENACITHSR